eukprot:gene15466-17311_t
MFVKIVIEDEIKKAALEEGEPFSYKNLKQIVLKLYPVLQNRDFKICYHDEENDLVTLSSDEELNVALNFLLHQPRTLKFTVRSLYQSISMREEQSLHQQQLANLRRNVLKYPHSPDSFKFHVDGNFLVFTECPNNLLFRSKMCRGKHLLIRDAYEKIYEKITEILKSQNPEHSAAKPFKNPWFVITGTAGIDLLEINYPLQYEGELYVFTSFNPNRYKEIQKVGYTFIMPTWSGEELEEYFNSHYFCENKVSVANARNNALIFGGIIRSIIYGEVNILKDQTIECAVIEDALSSTKSNAFLSDFFKVGFGTEINDVFVHRNPKKVKGDYVYSSNPIEVRTFASSYVFRQILKKYEQSQISSTREKFRSRSV